MAENSNHIEGDIAAMRVSLWDLGPPKDDPSREAWDRDVGPHQREMWSVDARESLQRAPGRYVVAKPRSANMGLPKGVHPGPAEAVRIRRLEEEQGIQSAARAADPVFGTGATP